jgi:hypothetical protein
MCHVQKWGRAIRGVIAREDTISIHGRYLETSRKILRDITEDTFTERYK